MITFKVIGRVCGVSRSKYGDTSLRILPDGDFKFLQQKEEKAQVLIYIPKAVTGIPTLQLDAHVEVEGTIGVGVVEWENSEGRVKDIFNHHFEGHRAKLLDVAAPLKLAQ